MDVMGAFIIIIIETRDEEEEEVQQQQLDLCFKLGLTSSQLALNLNPKIAFLRIPGGRDVRF